MMPPVLSGIRQELRPMVSLALPVILAEIGWTTMGLVDTLMVGPLGPAAIGAVGLGSIVFVAIGIFGMGLLLGLDTLVAQSFGAGRRDQCEHWLRQGVYLALLSAVPLTLLSFGVTASLPFWGLNSEVLVLASPYLNVVTLSVLPLLLYAAFRRYLQAVNLVRPITFALVSANLVNVLVNWILIYGKFGFPALGPTGAAWATVLSRVYLATVLLVAVREARRGLGATAATSRRLEWAGVAPAPVARRPGGAADPARGRRVRRGIRPGRTPDPGRPGGAPDRPEPLVVRLHGPARPERGRGGEGRAGGRTPGPGRRPAGGMDGARCWPALFTASAAVVFLVAARPLIGAFSQDVTVLALGPSLLAIAGVCLVFDGTQGVATGILRGLGETRIPMFANFAGHWLVGLPLGYAACFWWGWGVQGLWLGLAAGLIGVGTVLLFTWNRRARSALPDAPCARFRQVTRRARVGPPIRRGRGTPAFRY